MGFSWSGSVFWDLDTKVRKIVSELGESERILTYRVSNNIFNS